MVEKFKFGQFSLTPEEMEKAKKEGTLEKKEFEMNMATEKLRTKQSEEAIAELEKFAKEEEFDKAA